MNNKFSRIKQHFYDNRKVYIATGIGLAVGAVTILLIKNHEVVTEISMPRFLSPGDNNVMKVYINPLGDPGNVVQCVETGTIYASQGQAARELGISSANMSKIITGKGRDIGGNHFVVLGKAGKVLAENT